MVIKTFAFVHFVRSISGEQGKIVPVGLCHHLAGVWAKTEPRTGVPLLNKTQGKKHRR